MGCLFHGLFSVMEKMRSLMKSDSTHYFRLLYTDIFFLPRKKNGKGKYNLRSLPVIVSDSYGSEIIISRNMTR